jgi:hypothetical protein
MRYTVNVLTLAFLWGMILHVPVVAEDSGFHKISDDGNERVERTFPCGVNRICTVSRVIVQRNNYDGPPGYTAILVRSEQVPGPGIWKEELTVFVRGQYRLLGFDSKTVRVLCYKTAQRGVSGTIVNIVAFDSEHSGGQNIGPEGVYQYVSCNDNGRYCILVDAGVVMVDMETGVSRRIPSLEKIPPDAADPPHKMEEGYWIGAGYSTSDEFVEMSWKNTTTGVLTVRDYQGNLVVEIPVAWESGD